MIKKFIQLTLIALLASSIIFSGVLNYRVTNAYAGSVYFTQIYGSDRAQFAVNEIIQGQNIDISNYKNINGDSLNKNQILENLGSLGMFTIYNNLNTPVSLKLKVRIATDREGDLMELMTDPTAYTIDVPSKNTKVFNSTDVYHINKVWVNGMLMTPVSLLMPNS